MVISQCRTAAIAILAGAAALAPATALAGVVVAASGPSAERYPQGRTIADQEPVALVEGDSVTVIGDKGARVLSGAGTHSLGQETGPGKRGAFAELTARRTGDAGGEQPGAAQAPNLWYVDVDRPGTVCLPATDRVRLWRSASEGDTTYVISAAESGATQTVKFTDGETLAAWDTRAVPVTPGALYRLGDGDGVVVTELSFVAFDPADDPERLAGQLIRNGCAGQLELLTSALMLGEE